MLNKNYESKLQNTVVESISNQIIFAYLSLLQDSCIFMDEEINETINMSDNNINETVKFIQTCVKDLENIFSLEDEAKEELSTQIIQHKKLIISKYETFCSYSNQYNI